MKNIPRRFPYECVSIFITLVVETTMKIVKKIKSGVKSWK